MRGHFYFEFQLMWGSLFAGVALGSGSPIYFAATALSFLFALLTYRAEAR
jgi:hypothetical protein